MNVCYIQPDVYCVSIAIKQIMISALLKVWNIVLLFSYLLYLLSFALRIIPHGMSFDVFVFVQLITDNNIVFVMSNMAIFINVCFEFSWYTMTSSMSIMDITRRYVKNVYFINICFEFSWYIMTSTMSIFDMIRRYAQSDFTKRSPLLCFGMETRGPFY